MLKFRFSNVNGVHRSLSFSLLHGLQHLLLYSTSSSSTKSTQSLSNYLVEFLGFSKEQSLSTSIKLAKSRQVRGVTNVSHFNFAINSDNVIDFFKNKGFDRSQIRDIILRVPLLLVCKIDKTLKPKFDFFNQKGFSGSELTQFLTANPSILMKSLNSGVIPAMRTFRDVLGSDEDSITILKLHWKHIMCSAVTKNLARNVVRLRDHGIPIESIRKHIRRLPTPYLRKPKSFEETLIRVEEKLGIPPNSAMFLYGVHLASCLKDRTIDNKCRVFKRFGWTDNDIRAVIRKHPYCLVPTETRIENSLNFLMNELGYEPAKLSLRPLLLMFSLEKRLVPRYRILLVLKEKGLIVRKDCLFYQSFCCSDLLFLNKFVLPFKEVHELYAKHFGGPPSPLRLLIQRVMKSSRGTVGKGINEQYATLID